MLSVSVVVFIKKNRRHYIRNTPRINEGVEQWYPMSQMLFICLSIKSLDK
jgi:hypothetical protein